jgi:Glycosyl transferase family 2
VNAARATCSVITPTWQRHDLLLDRCIPSVAVQDHPSVQHVIVSDGPDPELRGLLSGPSVPAGYSLAYAELPEHDPEPHYGWRARLRGLELAAGSHVTYCDDDDALRPAHCSLMAAALDADPGAGFAVSRMMCHYPGGKRVTGWGRLECGNVGSPMIMHWKEITAHGTWRNAGLFEDWDLIQQWLDAGIRYTSVNAETSDVWPSRFREEDR